MARQSKIAKYQRQQYLVAKYAEQRYQLKKEKNYQALAQLPKDSHPNRLKNRDMLDGRARGFCRKFGLSRIHMRELALKGLLPGVKKASW